MFIVDWFREMDLKLYKNIDGIKMYGNDNWI